MTTRVSINPKVLKWASDRSSKGLRELDERFPKLRQWLSGDEDPTLVQLELFSKATSTPLGFLFLDAPPIENLPIPNYRTLDDETVRAPSSELLDTIYTMERRQAWMREYLVSEGREPVAIVNCATRNEASVDVAARLREKLALDINWAAKHSTWTDALKELRAAMGAAGVVVVVNGIVGNNTHRPLDVEEFRGFVLVDEYAPLVFVNGADAKSAQMFTLSHELAHIAFGSSAAFDLRQMQPAKEPIEQACNRVAAEFLVPEGLLKKAWNPKEHQSYEVVAKIFKVSPIVAARRLLDLGLISREEFFKFYQNYITQEHKRAKPEESGGNFYATAAQRVGARFAVELIRALKEGRVLHTEAYRLAGMNGQTFDEFARRIRQGGIE
ncbi:MAG TPA: ImmA/IrrE family metallo-endopeptidase [Phycisphaerae bacterium]|nr:ImmA/IrrE family metallo-endopeptidase [Phycisphaerae bacterium]